MSKIDFTVFILTLLVVFSFVALKLLEILSVSWWFLLVAGASPFTILAFCLFIYAIFNIDW